ncbi:hypothetical protein BP6252_07933 [Coleophoma cylindrospora]|uniref:separase n=1 Tax=Coleophoma cylindrospora TaxID=1849047 RepID=A0A3D8RBL2_9HELO|nr:hypothetical protein BP6252_07933 [Coleophoma cylindrospora]
MTSIQANAEAVRAAVSSTTTCTPATTTILTDLLLPKAIAGELKSNGGKVPISRTKPGKAAPAKTRGRKTPGLDASQEHEETLSIKERSILATEVINATLKAMGEALKAPPQSRKQPSTKEPGKSSARQALRRSISVPQSPSTRRSLSRVSSSPNLSSKRSRSSSNASITASSGHRACAECARTAFSCLRSLQATKSAGLQLPTLQIENGMSVLIGKLIALGLDDLAIKELRILKRRLAPEEHVPNPKKPDPSSKAVQPSPQGFADLLDFGNSFAPGTKLGLIISTQLQILRLMTSSQKYKTTEAALRTLQTSHPSSPTNLLLLASKDPKGTNKAARQLQSVSELLLSLSPSISASHDELSVDPRLSVGPEAAFQFQILALQNRLVWWKLAGHDGDVAKDILSPFLRCLSAFARRSESQALQTQKIASNSFLNLQKCIREYCDVPVDAPKTYCGIHKLLSSLCYEAQLFDEAIIWTEKLRAFTDTELESDARRCAVIARLATLTIQNSSDYTKMEELLMGLLEGLERPFKGETGEIEDLLAEVSTTRRAAISLLAKNRSPDSKTLLSGVLQMCESLVFLCPRLSLRYLGKSPDSKSATKDILQHEQRRMFMRKPGLNAVDSALFLVRMHLNEGRLTWELMDSILTNCISLLEELNSCPSASSLDSKAPAATSYFVRISHLYYSQYLNMRRDAHNAKDVQYIRALRRSIDCVLTRPQVERRAASLSIKLERVAEIYKTTGRYDELFKTLLKLRDEALEYGALTTVASAAASQPLDLAWNLNEDTLLLARTVNSMIKVILKYGFSAEDMPISDESWTSAEMGAMLEQELIIVSGSTNNHSVTVLRNKIFQKLASVYDAKQYPIRRLRAFVSFLALDSCHRQEISKGAAEIFDFAEIKVEEVTNTNDVELVRYLPNLQAVAKSLAQLQQDQPKTDVLRDCLAAWSSILDECQTLEELEGKVEDVQALLSHLHSIADFMSMKGLGNTRTAVLRLIATLTDLCDNSSYPDRGIICYTDLALQWVHLGYTGKAGLALEQAQSRSTLNGLRPETLLELHLTYSEYLLAIGTLDKCEERLQRAQAIVYQEEQFLSALKTSANPRQRIKITQLIGHAFLVHSILALERGSPQTALNHAKQSVRLLRQAWAQTEKQCQQVVRYDETNEKSDVEKLSEECSTLSLSQISAISKTSKHGIGFWGMVNPLYQSLTNIAEIYAHNGMFQETLYYAEQAQKLVQEIGSEFFITMSSAVVGGTWLKAGCLDKASEILAQARDLSKSHELSTHSISVACSLGVMHGRLGDREAESKVYEDAGNTLKKLTTPTYVNSIDHIVRPESILEVKMSSLTISKAKPKPTRKAPIRTKVAVKRKATVKVVPAANPLPSVSEECPKLLSLSANILRQKATALMTGQDYEGALQLLEEADLHVRTQADVANQGIVMARNLLLQSLEQMDADPVYSILQDSTISFPSVAGLARSDKIPSNKNSPPSKRSQAAAYNSDRIRSKSPAPNSFFDNLRRAQQHLTDVHATAALTAPVSVVHTISTLMSSISVLLSTAGQVKGKPLGNPGYASCLIENARNVALRRERKALQVDQLSSINPGEVSWPILPAGDSRRSSLSTMHDISRFQKDYIDIIPEAWNAISISLSDSRQELTITRFHAGYSPFILRLPLGRNTSIDADEEIFGFEQGHAELMDIIKLANESAHNGGDMTTKAARSAWWEGREELDARLKDLLENVEKVWLGGFKGIFSQEARRPDLLARFQKSFQNILDKHLPSRQKMGKRTKNPQITLDTRILDLFIGLGDASAEDCDLDEPLNDLLYFVVDVLQFHGELNAYAEIDFDSIVIEIHDALRCYHEAIQASGQIDENRHTVLILDKSLHAFPWESLPCMEGLAVSRLPSLGCLRDRILEQQSTRQDGDVDGCYIARENGSFILNPGGDLKSTQTTFQKDLQSLDGWEGQAKHEPSEAEFRTYLESKDLFLYFGHGSGAQYIRAREIRRLKKCAVTMLMGCSSSHLVDAGDFEPYGPPINYMHAGCPAVVGTLWDVTDKDIDRFAKTTLEKWGLFESHVKAGKKKCRGGEDESISRGKISLIEAVVKGKGACNLRYLNGAAVCVYGVPVYIR